MARKFSVLVYSGAGVSPSSLHHTIKSLRVLLSPYYTVTSISTSSLLTDPWFTSCALLVLPGGRDIPYHTDLAGKGNEVISKFVREGGSYLGICAGGYYGASEIKFMMEHSTYKVHAFRELGFWEGTCEGTVFPGFEYSSEKGTRPVTMDVDLEALKGVLEKDGRKVGKGMKKSVSHLYYNGGGAFVPPASSDPQTTFGSSPPVVVARYAEAPNRPNAAVFSHIGLGRSLLCGTHPEYSLLEDPLQSALQRMPGGGPSQEELVGLEEDRLELMKTLLLTLGVGVPETEEQDKLERPTHPLPQFLVSHPSKPNLPADFVSKISSHFTKPTANDTTSTSTRATVSTSSDGPSILADTNDTFHFHQSTSFPSISSYLSQARTTTLSLDEAEDLDALVKHVIVADKEEGTVEVIEREKWTPLFNWSAYWKELDLARKHERDKGGHAVKMGETRLGDLMMYSEAVTSTQTMLDKNPHFLHSLPTPLVSTASYQLSGRGRSGNVWLSPTGCLQFTMAFTLPTSKAPKVVFIQYLAALAISEALDPGVEGGRSEGVLGVRIKWPNDVYALVKGEGGKIDKVKIGGVLVNSNYANGQFKIMVGCGINILNALPTTSLSLLTKIYNDSLPANSTPLPTPTMEGSLARVLARFGSMWEQFIAAPGGGFEPFLTDYLDRWLHSDQLVHLLTTNPPTPVRVTTITLDHGMLRTTPVKTVSYGGEYDRSSFLTASKGYKEPEFIDLQPDGNSFDLMANMIRRKQ